MESSVTGTPAPVGPASPSPSLESFVDQILAEALSGTTVSSLERMDQWLGISVSDDDDDDDLELTVEDCAPFSSKLYELVSSMILFAWDPTASSTSTSSTADSTSGMNGLNVLIEELYHLKESGVTQEEDLIQAITLQCIPAIRVTKWIRHWMECNVDEHSTSSTSNSTTTNTSFSHYLLVGQQYTPHYSEALFKSLFLHMTLLPTYQSQLLLFNQAFQRGDFTGQPTLPKHKNLLPTTTTTTTALADPTHRLRHYQRAQQLAQRLTQEYNDHLQSIEAILGDWYSTTPTLRPLGRSGLGRVWLKFQLQNTSGTYAPSLRGENTSASGLDVTLRVLYRILLGMQTHNNNNNPKATSTTTSTILEELLFHQLLPLHQPNAMVLWRDQTSLLELYHEPLVQCMAHILKQYHPNHVAPVCQALLIPSESIWPVGGNTPKQVLLLHEVDTYLGLLLPQNDNEQQEKETQQQPQPFNPTTFGSILSTIAQCMASEHSRLAERALTLFRNAVFKNLVMEVYYAESLRVLLPALTRSSSNTSTSMGGSNIPWNPTVRKMTFHVLKNLQQNNPEQFASVTATIRFGMAAEPTTPTDMTTTTASTTKSPLLAGATSSESSSSSPSSIPAFNQRFSLQAGMGNWRPPSAKGRKNTSNTSMPPPSARPPPPLSVTGVAPWAQSKNSKVPTGARNNPPSTVTGVAPWAAKPKQNPPLTVTGVAPWATTTTTSRLPPAPKSHKRSGAPTPPAAMPPRQKLPPPSPPQPEKPKEASPSSPPSIQKGDENDDDDNNKKPSSSTCDNNPGLAYVLRYMEQCKPPGMDENEDENASSSWSKAQMSETPTLLPDLKFHDLVFGQELGQGAFGVVKYARLIDRNKTRSQWPEYAVKIIATEKMKELGYEYGVAREIACLHLVSHPNVARLVSSFRFQQGAYLVLEYASGGDLHQLLQKHGSLDVPSCQFVLGEVIAALASLHDDLGFVYGDLKPENIVLSETGHVKLTDFGACRPFTAKAKEMLQRQMGKSGKNLLGTLREGDPRKLNKPQQLEQQSTLGGVIEEDEGEEEECSGWMSTDDDDKGGDGKLINDDTMQVVDNSEKDHQSEEEEEEVKEDLRIEGTTAYLPPEVVMGAIPTPAADSWALGCVLYQCLSGRPPILEADEAMTRNRIVTFEASGGDASMGMSTVDNDPLFGKDQKHAADITEPAKALIRSLLERVSVQRPSMQQAAQHEFFDGQNVLQLYQKPAYPLDVGGVAPAPPEAQWSRRQFSSIWAPQPHAYDISGTSTLQGTNRLGVSSAPIVEADEVGSSFSHTHFHRTVMASSHTNKNGDKPTDDAGAEITGSTEIKSNGCLAPLPQIEEDDVSMASADG
ncbi:IPL1-related protein kinase 2 [Seminavis robusta]|uniref:non-specific serine/threonine protein kinase n=1 Tax=Seminavis robusta TaxID=568900 RepID=A0A9N8DUD3_9STRA|nr:IPL1-related protein kinase 2 [Seminavis robusta]|eukprot:Sro255_g100420.1 IPL1-related protein kinase 2 (1355) ;mRNA; r:50518-54582